MWVDFSYLGVPRKITSAMLSLHLIVSVYPGEKIFVLVLVWFMYRFGISFQNCLIFPFDSDSV